MQSDPESESESESIRSPVSESELESEQHHHDSAPIIFYENIPTHFSGDISCVPKQKL